MAKRSFQKCLRDWRESRGYSQAEAAGYLRVPLRTYQGWERGRPPQQEGPIRVIIEEEIFKHD